MATHDITELLHAWGRGDDAAVDRLFTLLYDELRLLARRQLRGRHGQTLDTTAMVHEAYVKLVDPSRVGVADRAHFLNLAARVMRQVLIDRARRRVATKRGAGAVHTDLDGVGLPQRAEELLVLDEALGVLERLDARLARTVELRFFAGLSVEEAADALSVSPRTVKRDWVKARAFLHCQMSGEAGREPAGD
jgi:RNA polymerase sigma factor (TIGR02999 family)